MMIKKNGDLLDRYHRIMKGLASSHRHVRLSKKLSLDFCYTLVMWILDIFATKGISVSEKLGQQLLNNNIKVQIGPVTFSCLKSISINPNLMLQSLNYIKISSQQDKTTSNSISTSFIRTRNEIKITPTNIKATLESKDTILAESLMNVIIDTNEDYQAVSQSMSL